MSKCLDDKLVRKVRLTFKLQTLIRQLENTFHAWNASKTEREEASASHKQLSALRNPGYTLEQIAFLLKRTELWEDECIQEFKQLTQSLVDPTNTIPVEQRVRTWLTYPFLDEDLEFEIFLFKHNRFSLKTNPGAHEAWCKHSFVIDQANDNNNNNNESDDAETQASQDQHQQPQQQQQPVALMQDSMTWNEALRIINSKAPQAEVMRMDILFMSAYQICNQKLALSIHDGALVLSADSGEMYSYARNLYRCGSDYFHEGVPGWISEKNIPYMHVITKMPYHFTVLSVQEVNRVLESSNGSVEDLMSFILDQTEGGVVADMKPLRLFARLVTKQCSRYSHFTALEGISVTLQTVISNINKQFGTHFQPCVFMMIAGIKLPDLLEGIDSQYSSVGSHFLKKRLYSEMAQ